MMTPDVTSLEVTEEPNKDSNIASDNEKDDENTGQENSKIVSDDDEDDDIPLSNLTGLKSKDNNRNTSKHEKGDESTSQTLSESRVLQLTVKDNSGEIVSDDDDEVPISRSAARIILSSDDDDEEKSLKDPEENKKPQKNSVNRRHKRLITSDSEDEDKDAEDNMSVDDILEDRRGASESEEEELPDIQPVYKTTEPQPINRMTLDPDVYGNSSDEEGDRRSVRSSITKSHDESEPENGSKKKGKKSTKNKKLPQRKASEKSREKTMQELASQTQKMVRESRVSLPYHKPKQLTLDAFLKKRNKAKAPLHSSLINSASLGTMRDTIMTLEEDVLPILAEVEKDKQERKEKEAKKIAEAEELEIARSKITVMDWLTVNDGQEMEVKDPLQPDYEPMIDVQAEPVDTNVGSVDKLVEMEDVSKLNQQIVLDEKQIGHDDLKSSSISTEDTTEQSATNQADTIKSTEEAENSSKVLELSTTEVKSVSTDIGIPCPIETSSVSIPKPKPANIIEADNKAMEHNNSSVLETTDHSAVFHNQEVEENNPKPKRKSVAELLKTMPGFDKIASLKPKLGGSLCQNPGGFIELGDFKKPKKSRNLKGIQTLMDRFVKHASVTNTDHTEHHKVHINKIEKDSQGGLHAVVDEFDYVVLNPADEEEDVIAQISGITSSSNRNEPAAGEKLFRLQEVLGNQIRAKKKKEHEERERMDKEEKKLENKDNEDFLPDDEDIIEDDDIELSDSESDQDEENDGEDEDESDEEERDENLVYTKSNKKQRKRIIYFDDEAEDEDAISNDASDEESDGDERGNVAGLINDDDDLISLSDIHEDDSKYNEDFADSLPLGKPKHNGNAAESKGENAIKDNDEVGFENDDTPRVTAANLKQRTPADIWNPFSNCKSKSDDIVSVEVISKNSSDKEVSAPIAMLVAETTEPSENLSDLCSGNFPSQAPATPYETQNCFGFDDMDDEELIESCDNALVESQIESSKVISTPSENQDTPRVTDLNVDTPKMSDKVVKVRSLGQRFEIEARQMRDTPSFREKTCKMKLDFGTAKDITTSAASTTSVTFDSDNEDEIGFKVQKKRKRKLEFSDDEDDEKKSIKSDKDDDVDVDDKLDIDKPENEQEDECDEEDEESELERQLVLQSEKPKPKGLFGVNGQLRKKFVEEEAELSGSEEGSGDEDERGLNFYEREEGDADELDEDDVRNHLEKAHLKHLLDTDDRDIRKLQETYLERGDLEDGRQRQRKFRWHGVDDSWADEQARMGDSDGDMEDEEEVKRKIEAIERRKWIHEHSEIFEAAEEESQKLLFGKTKYLKLGKCTMKKIESFVECSSSFLMNESSSSVSDVSFSSLLKSKITPKAKALFSTKAARPGEDNEDLDDPMKLCKAASQPLFASPDDPLSKIKKGSFLSRGSPTLSRLAEITKVNDSTNNVKNNSRNFVFSVITPPDQASKQMGPKRPSRTQSTTQPQKMPRMDRSFSNLDDSSKDSSIFKWF